MDVLQMECRFNDRRVDYGGPGKHNRSRNSLKSPP
jgi:hypothetical protein